MARLSLDEIMLGESTATKPRRSLDEIMLDRDAAIEPRFSLDEIMLNPAPAQEEKPITASITPQQRPMREMLEKGIAQAEAIREPMTLHDLADMGKRGIYNFDAGMASSIGSGLQGVSWGLNKGVGGANAAYNFIADKVGLPQIDTSKMDPISSALYQSGQGWSDLSRQFAEAGTSGEENNLFDATASGLGSTIPFMLLGAAGAGAAGTGAGGAGALLPATDIAAKWAKLKAFAGAAGASEAISEAGGVFNGILEQGGSMEEADSAATKTFLINLPINVASDAVGGVLGEGGGMVRKAVTRGIPEFFQEIMQGATSDVTGERKEDKTPLTWSDMAKAIPGMVKSVPEKAKNEGLPAFLSSGLLGLLEGAHGNIQESRARKADERRQAEIEKILAEVIKAESKPVNTETKPASEGGHFPVRPDEPMAWVEPNSPAQSPTEGQTSPEGATMPSGQNDTPLRALAKQVQQNPQPVTQRPEETAVQTAINTQEDAKKFLKEHVVFGTVPETKTPAPETDTQTKRLRDYPMHSMEELEKELARSHSPEIIERVKKEIEARKNEQEGDYWKPEFTGYALPSVVTGGTARQEALTPEKSTPDKAAPNEHYENTRNVYLKLLEEEESLQRQAIANRRPPVFDARTGNQIEQAKRALLSEFHIGDKIESRDSGKTAVIVSRKNTGYVLDIEGDDSSVVSQHDIIRRWNPATHQEAPPAPKKPEPVSNTQTPETRMASIVADKLERGESLGNNIEFAKIGEEAYGTKRGEVGRETKDEYDAMELGVNKYIERRGYNPSTATVEQAKADLQSIERDILSKLPNTERTRSAEQEQLQQFSTPPNLSYVANWLLGAGKDDVVLEPSAGVGGLLTFAKNAGATTVANEISKRRYNLLTQMSFDAVHNVDASYIDSLLPKDITPTRVIMNPPFSSGLIEGKARDNGVGRTHVARALSKLADDGRAVIILGEGMGLDTKQGAKFWGDMKKKYNVRAVVGVDGSNYKKYGTSFNTVMAVVDKTGPTTEAPIGGKVSDLNQLIDMLDDVSKDGPDGLPSSRGVAEIREKLKNPRPEDDARLDQFMKKAVEAEEDFAKKAEQSVSAEENVRRGRAAMERVIKDHADVRDAMYRDDTGGISFLYGEPGDAPYYMNGSGISHIIAKRTAEGMDAKEFLDLLIDVLATGEKGEVYSRRNGRPRVDITKGPITVVLGKVRNGEKVTWVVTGWDERVPVLKKPRSGVSSEEQGSPGTTLSETTPPVTEREQNKASNSSSEASPRVVEPVVGRLSPSSDSAIEGREDVRDVSVASSKATDKPLQRRRAEETMTVAQKNLSELQAERAAAASGADDDQSLFESYVPQKLKVPDAKGHPADLAQSAAMASVEPPDVTYTPTLPQKMIEEGRLSEAQLEAITYAGQSFEQTNRDGSRRGFFIGDGTGVGKGREISGIITDQLAQGHGKGKAVWISEKWKLIDDAKRDWEDIGNDPGDIFSQEIKTAFPDKGVLFSAYTMIRGKDGKRLKQLTDWLGKDFDGVIALDEVHNANNIVEGESEGGGGFKKKKIASDTAKNILALTKMYPKARILYVSATGATEVDNLGMLDRLGLWEPGTAFGSRAAFLEQIRKGGKAAMELVARDMKQMGLYISRNISFRRGKYGKEDVTYRRLEHQLSGDQKTLYNEITRAWQHVFENMEAAIDSIVGEEKDQAKRRAARVRAVNRFWSAEQASFKGIIGAMKLPAMIEDMRRQLEKGNSVVVQLTQTNEAALKNAVSKMEEGDSYEDINLTPKEALISFLKNSFPVNEYHEVVIGENENGKPVTQWQALKDDRGNFVENPEAVAIRDELISNINSIRFPDSPLDTILNAFGADNVAEITGRSQRLVTRNGKRVLEKISPGARKTEAEAFQDGKKRILVFSEAGGTGASYHADARAKNQEKRIHYLLDGGWKAAAAIQGFGRTHRTNQVHAPEYVLVATDLPGERRFISTIAKRLEQLGALTTGERRTQTNGLFSERDNLESEYAKNAVLQLFHRIAHGNVDSGHSPQALLGMMGFGNIISEDGGINASKFPGVNQFLNRLLALPYDTQHVVFDEFSNLIDLEIQKAIEAGEYDMGTQMIKADRIEVESEKVVHEGENGTKTSYVRIKRYTKQTPMAFDEVNKSKPKYYIVKRSGNIAAAIKTKATVTDPKTGLPYDKYNLLGVDPALKGVSNEKALQNDSYYTEVSEEEARRLWDKQIEEFPEYREDTDHLITGAILPIWDRLDDSRVEVNRVRTDDGKSYLGRRIDSKSIGATLRRLGIDYDGPKLGVSDVLKAIAGKKKVVQLANGWTIRQATVNGENRTEIVGPDFSKRNYLDGLGVMSERINWGTRWFIPSSKEAALAQILKDSPVVEVRDVSIRQQSANVLNEGVDDEAPPMGFSIRLVPSENNPLVQTAEVSEKFEFNDKETEERYQKARKSIDRGNAMSGLKESAAEFVKGFTSDFPKIAAQKYDLARETLRKMNRLRQVAITNAIDSMRAAVRGMSPNQSDLFSRKAILDDLVYQKQEMPDSELPYGFTDRSLIEDHKRVTAAVEKDPVIMKALENERDKTQQVNREMIAIADKIGWHSLSEKFKNPHYFRHVVIEYAEAASQGRAVGLKAPENRGYLKKRKGSSKDILSNYVQAMGEVRALQLQDIEVMKALKVVKDNYDISERLKRLAFTENEDNFLATVAAAGKKFLDLNDEEAAAFAHKQMSKLNQNQAMALSSLFKMASNGALPEGKFTSLVQDMADAGAYEALDPANKKQFGRYLSWLASLKDDAGTREARIYFKYTDAKKKVIAATLGKENVTWRDMMPEGYVEYHPFHNRLVFSVNTVAENIIEQALEQGLNELNIPMDMLRKMNVLGGHRQSWAIPQELAETLDKLDKPIERGMLGKAAKVFTSIWKQTVLLSPARLFKYNARNISGDADAVMAGNPGSFRFLPRAFHELYQVYKVGKAPEGELAEFAARGGAVGSLHLSELGDETSIKEFKAILDKGEAGLATIPKKFWHGYWNRARMSTDFRENLLRYATYLSYLEQMQKSETGTPRNYGASKRTEVLVNQDIRDRAYKLSNELLGAYDQVSETGQYLRDIAIPFLSWMEVNARRYYQIFRNGMETGDIGSVAKRTLMGQVMKSPAYAWRLGKTAFKVSLFLMFITAYNNLVWPEEEEDLPPDIRHRPHLILWRNPDGTIKYFDRIGALADTLDWFALDSAYGDIKDILNGHQSLGDYAKKMAQAPVNKLFNAINPIPKTAIEIMSGKQYFPDVFNPRSIRDMGVYLANTVGLAPEFVAITGRPSRGYLHDRLGNMFTYSVDPEEASYWWILDKKRQFQENELGTSWSGGYSTSARGQALWNIKRAIRFGDGKAVSRYAREYLEYGGTGRGLETSLKSMAPLAGLSEENKMQFLEWLSAEDRGYLGKAQKHYHSLLSNFGVSD